MKRQIFWVHNFTWRKNKIAVFYIYICGKLFTRIEIVRSCHHILDDFDFRSKKGELVRFYNWIKWADCKLDDLTKDDK